MRTFVVVALTLVGISAIAAPVAAQGARCDRLLDEATRAMHETSFRSSDAEKQAADNIAIARNSRQTGANDRCAQSASRALDIIKRERNDSDRAHDRDRRR
jgi:hypothetical protein